MKSNPNNNPLDFDINTKEKRLEKKYLGLEKKYWIDTIHVPIFMILAILIFIGFGILETQRLETKTQPTFSSPVRTAMVNNFPTSIHISKKGKYTARVKYEYCYERKWSKEEICDRAIVRVVFVEVLPEPKK